MERDAESNKKLLQIISTMEKSLQENGYGKDEFNDQEGVGDVSKYMLQQNPLEKARCIS